jgi:DNA-binding GntR family transcriptional regulator
LASLPIVPECVIMRDVTGRPTDEVYDHVRGLIVSGRIAPGTRLVETELARTLDVSRTPVREAIRRLAQEGLANAVGTGAKLQVAVAPATVADLLDLFAIIGALEGVASRGIAALGRAERSALARNLGVLNDRFARLSRRPLRTPEFFDSHDAFHAAFVERCASNRLRQLIEAVRPQVKRYELLYATAIGAHFNASLREHKAIIAAIRMGHPDRAERAVRWNWCMSAKRLARGVTERPASRLGDYRTKAG